MLIEFGASGTMNFRWCLWNVPFVTHCLMCDISVLWTLFPIYQLLFTNNSPETSSATVYCCFSSWYISIIIWASFCFSKWYKKGTSYIRCKNVAGAEEGAKSQAALSASLCSRTVNLDIWRYNSRFKAMKQPSVCQFPPGSKMFFFLTEPQMLNITGR
jgi:hypothetical protein